MTGHRSNKSIAEFWEHCLTLDEWKNHPRLTDPSSFGRGLVGMFGQGMFLNDGGDGKRFWVEVVVVVVCFAKKTVHPNGSQFRDVFILSSHTPKV